MNYLSKEDALMILDLPIDCSDQAIRRRYRRLALQWHPERNNESKESITKFIQYTQAYGRLQCLDVDDANNIFERVFIEMCMEKRVKFNEVGRSPYCSCWSKSKSNEIQRNKVHKVTNKARDNAKIKKETGSYSDLLSTHEQYIKNGKVNISIPVKGNKAASVSINNLLSDTNLKKDGKYETISLNADVLQKLLMSSLDQKELVERLIKANNSHIGTGMKRKFDKMHELSMTSIDILMEGTQESVGEIKLTTYTSNGITSVGSISGFPVSPSSKMPTNQRSESNAHLFSPIPTLHFKVEEVTDSDYESGEYTNDTDENVDKERIADAVRQSEFIGDTASSDSDLYYDSGDHHTNVGKEVDTIDHSEGYDNSSEMDDSDNFNSDSDSNSGYSSYNIARNSIRSNNIDECSDNEDCELFLEIMSHRQIKKIPAWLYDASSTFAKPVINAGIGNGINLPRKKQPEFFDCSNHPLVVAIREHKVISELVSVFDNFAIQTINLGNGYSVLHCAARYNRLDCAKLIVDQYKGFNLLSSLSSEGLLPIDLSKFYGFKAMSRFLHARTEKYTQECTIEIIKELEDEAHSRLYGVSITKPPSSNYTQNKGKSKAKGKQRQAKNVINQQANNNGNMGSIQIKNQNGSLKEQGIGRKGSIAMPEIGDRGPVAGFNIGGGGDTTSDMDENNDVPTIIEKCPIMQIIEDIDYSDSETKNKKSLDLIESQAIVNSPTPFIKKNLSSSTLNGMASSSSKSINMRPLTVKPISPVATILTTSTLITEVTRENDNPISQPNDLNMQQKHLVSVLIMMGFGERESFLGIAATNDLDLAITWIMENRDIHPELIAITVEKDNIDKSHTQNEPKDSIYKSDLGLHEDKKKMDDINISPLNVVHPIIKLLKSPIKKDISSNTPAYPSLIPTSAKHQPMVNKLSISNSSSKIIQPADTTTTLSSSQISKPCIYFKRGHCATKSCRFAHITQPHSPVAKSSANTKPLTAHKASINDDIAQIHPNTIAPLKIHLELPPLRVSDLSLSSNFDALVNDTKAPQTNLGILKSHAQDCNPSNSTPTLCSPSTQPIGSGRWKNNIGFSGNENSSIYADSNSKFSGTLDSSPTLFSSDSSALNGTQFSFPMFSTNFLHNNGNTDKSQSRLATPIDTIDNNNEFLFGKPTHFSLFPTHTSSPINVGSDILNDDHTKSSTILTPLSSSFYTEFDQNYNLETKCPNK